MLKSIQSIRKKETRCIFFYFGRLLQMQMTLLWVLRLATFSLIFNSTQKPKDTFLKLYRDGIYTSFKARYLAEVVLWVNRVLFLAVFRFQRSGFKSRLVFSLYCFLFFFISLFLFFSTCFSSFKSCFFKFSKNHDWVGWLHFPVVDLPN